MRNDFEFPRIEEHGVVLNNRTAALVSKYGEIDFACFPNFDSQMIFFSLLDRHRGGYFRIRPVRNNLESRQHYEPDTNILFTTFYNNKKGKVLSIMDFLPMSTENYVYFSEIHRRIEAYSDVNLEIQFAPFLDEDRKKIEYFEKKGYMVYSGNSTQFLSTTFPLDINDGVVSGTVNLPASNVRWLVTTHDLKKAYSIQSFASDQRLGQTRRYWNQWLLKSDYQDIFYDVVNRSLLTLKGLFFDPTGFMVAAATTSIPESVGGERNWDYRFMWVRDTTYVMEVLVRLGYISEATKFYSTIMDRVEKDGRLYSVYPVSLDSIMKESILDLSGYLNSKPVRIGNDAHGQLQIDQYASLIIGLRMLLENGGSFSIHTLEKTYRVGEFLTKIWSEPDSSIWEIRGEKKEYVYSKAMAWKALTDLSWLQSKMGIPDDGSINSKLADQIKMEVYKKGISEEGYFTQSYGSNELDSSLLRLPLIGFCDVDDKIYRRTLKEIEKRLMPEEFLFKRMTLQDGLRGEDNAFLMLSFWYIRNLVHLGKLTRAYEGLTKIMSLLNDITLLPEEIEFKSHRYLGNYPQALSHLSLILAITEYNDAIEKQRG